MGLSERLEAQYAWVHDPAAVREVVDDVCRLLGLSATSTVTFQQVVADPEQVNARPQEWEPRLAAATEEVLDALPRRRINLGSLGIDEQVLRRALADPKGSAGQEIDAGELTLTPESVDALSLFAWQLPRRTRKRLCGTTSQVAIRAFLTTLRIAQERERRDDDAYRPSADDRGASASHRTSGRVGLLLAGLTTVAAVVALLVVYL